MNNLEGSFLLLKTFLGALKFFFSSCSPKTFSRADIFPILTTDPVTQTLGHLCLCQVRCWGGVSEAVPHARLSVVFHPLS